MIGLSDNMDIDETFDSSASAAMIAQSAVLHNGSFNSRTDLLDQESDISNETMRLLFITIAAITVLACLSICLSVCICVCLNRYVRQHTASEKRLGHERFSCRQARALSP